MKKLIVDLPIYGIVKNRALTFNWLINSNFKALKAAKRKFKRAIADQLKDLPQFRHKIHIHYTYYAAHNRKQNTDLDNFTLVHMKFFQDSLVTSGKIPDDNVKIIETSSQEFGGFDVNNPRVEAEIRIVGK